MLNPFPVAALLALALGAAQAAQQGAAPPTLRVSLVQGSVHLISGAGANITVQVGSNGVLLVDTPAPAQAPAVMAEVRKLSPMALRYIIQTSVSNDAVGGTAAVLGPVGGRGLPFGFVGLNRASVIAHENVLNRLSAAGDAGAAAGIAANHHLFPADDGLRQQRAHHPLPPAGGPYRQRHGGAVPQVRRDQELARRFHAGPLSDDLHRPRRCPCRDWVAALGTIPQWPDPRRSRTAARRCARPRPYQRGDRRRRVPRHGGDHQGPRAGPDQEGQHAGPIKAAKPSRDYDAEYGATAADAERFVESIHRSLTQKPGGRS